MNERIKELLSRAGFNATRNTDVVTNNHWGGYMDGRQFEKFAELIVRECVQVGGPEDSYTDEWFKAKADSMAKIKHHFGVE
jgi:hypothetical protein